MFSEITSTKFKFEEEKEMKENLNEVRFNESKYFEVHFCQKQPFIALNKLQNILNYYFKCKTIKSLPKSDINSWIEQLYKCQFLHFRILQILCKKVKEILIKEPNIVPLKCPITICGDTHGQFYDLMELFNVGGFMPDANYLFLGDYVCRGYYSVEVMELLLCLKLRYPNKITLLRGNWDNRTQTIAHGFFEECQLKYRTNGANAWTLFNAIFDCLPLTATVENKLFCVHGGLSPQINTLNDITNINRFRETPYEGPFCDLLWTDPDDRCGWGIIPKGIGYYFGSDITHQFNYLNGFDCIIRSRQLILDGFNWCHEKQLLTIFSAPNYGYKCGNKAAIMEIDEFMQHKMLVFDACPSKLRKIPDKLKTLFEKPDYFV